MPDGVCEVCGGRGWHTAGGNDPSACGACRAGDFYERGTTVYCKVCHKTHAVLPEETPCAPGAWIDEASGNVFETQETCS